MVICHVHQEPVVVYFELKLYFLHYFCDVAHALACDVCCDFEGW